MDFRGLWRSRQWRKLLNLIDWLPRNSAFSEAMSNDEDLAAALLSRPKDERSKQARRPRVSEYSPELERLIDVVDRLGEVMAATVAAAGGKPPKVRPQPRPETAMDRLREQQRYLKHKRTVSRVLVQQEDGSLRPLAEQGVSAEAAPAKPKILPGENPYRLTLPRRGRPAPPGS